MSLKLYFNFMSQPSRAMYILLKTNNIAFEECSIALHRGEHLTDKYKNEISRFQKVPVIDHDGYKLTESIAILRYLAREKGLPENIYPSESKEQSRVDEFLEWQHINLRIPCAMYFQLKYIIPKVTGAPPEQSLLTLYETKMIEVLDNMEELWLQDKPFINGNQISAADIWAACEIEQPRMAGYDPREGRQILSAWLDRVRIATNPFYDQAHALIDKIVATIRHPKSNL